MRFTRAKICRASSPATCSIAAFSAREDPRDAFCSERFATFESLPGGRARRYVEPTARIPAAALRPDLRYEEIRGNVDTRLRKLRDGQYDAIVLAMAGLNRLRRKRNAHRAFSAATLVPAVAQGALAIEKRGERRRTRAELYAAVNHEPTQCACEASAPCCAPCAWGAAHRSACTRSLSGRKTIMPSSQPRAATCYASGLRAASIPSQRRASSASRSAPNSPPLAIALDDRASCCPARRTVPAGSPRRCGAEVPK